VVLDRPHRRAKLGEHGGLIAAARSDLEAAVCAPGQNGLRHHRDDVRLADRLARADGQRTIVVRVLPHELRHESVPRNPSHRREHRLVDDPATREVIANEGLALLASLVDGSIERSARHGVVDRHRRCLWAWGLRAPSSSL
jgi:hypothetical protein